jgi:hypothetical protein
MPPRLSFSMDYSKPTKYAATWPTVTPKIDTIFPIVDSSVPSFAPLQVQETNKDVHATVAKLQGTGGSSSVGVMAVALVAVIAAVVSRKMRSTAAAS